MGRWGLLVGVLIGLATLVLQNLVIALPLVVFGQSVMVLPLGVWMGVAIAIGALGNFLLVMLGQAGAQGKRREPELRPARPKNRQGSARRQVVESLAEEIWEEDETPSSREQPEEEWSVGAGDGQTRRSPNRRRPVEGLEEFEASPEDEALEDVIGGWEEPNRSQQGWDYEPEWDEEEAWVRPGTGRRPTRSRPQPPSVTPRPSSGSPQATSTRSPQSPQSPPTPRPQSPPEEPPPPPPLKNFEKPGRPIQREQAGSVYSYRYRDDADEMANETVNTTKTTKTTEATGPEKQQQQPPQSAPTPQPLITPLPKESIKAPTSDAPPERSPSNPPTPARQPRTPLNLPPESEAPKPQRRSVMDAEYRVLRPPDPNYDDRRSPQGRDDWDELDNDFDRAGEDDWDDW